jgi:drug/metabolite transporter (DMT)-like permease
MTAGAVTHRSELIAVLVAVFGSVCVGTVPFLARELQTSGVDTVSLLWWRYVFGLSVLVPLAVRQRREVAPGWAAPATGLLLCGIFAAFQTFCYYKSIETVATSVVVTIFFAYPIFTLLLDRFALRIDVPRSTLAAILIIVTGVLMTSVPQLSMAGADATGLLLAALTPGLYAIYITVSFGFTRRLPTFAAAICLYLGQLIVFSVAVAALGLKTPATAAEWLATIAIATVGGSLQIASFAYALPRLSGSGYAVIVSLELVTVVILGVLLLGERLEPVQVLGVVLVLAGVLLDRLVRAWTRRTSAIRR